jgi:hypothetical protein
MWARSFHTLTIDFVTGLPKTKTGFDAVAIYTCKSTKRIGSMCLWGVSATTRSILGLFGLRQLKRRRVIHGEPAHLHILAREALQAQHQSVPTSFPVFVVHHKVVAPDGTVHHKTRPVVDIRDLNKACWAWRASRAKPPMGCISHDSEHSGTVRAASTET